MRIETHMLTLPRRTSTTHKHMQPATRHRTLNPQRRITHLSQHLDTLRRQHTGIVDHTIEIPARQTIAKHDAVSPISYRRIR